MERNRSVEFAKNAGIRTCRRDGDLCSCADKAVRVALADADVEQAADEEYYWQSLDRAEQEAASILARERAAFNGYEPIVVETHGFELIELEPEFIQLEAEA